MRKDEIKENLLEELYKSWIMIYCCNIDSGAAPHLLEKRTSIDKCLFITLVLRGLQEISILDNLIFSYFYLKTYFY